MIERTIYFNDEMLEEVKRIIEVVIPNDYKVFIKDYRFGKALYAPIHHVDLELENERDWFKLKKLYFPNYKKKALPGCIHLVNEEGDFRTR